jgi:hypothetical protein
MQRRSSVGISSLVALMSAHRTAAAQGGSAAALQQELARLHDYLPHDCLPLADRDAPGRQPGSHGRSRPGDVVLEAGADHRAAQPAPLRQRQRSKAPRRRTHTE